MGIFLHVEELWSFLNKKGWDTLALKGIDWVSKSRKIGYLGVRVRRECMDGREVGFSGLG